MGLGGEKNHKEPILEVPFMIPDSTAVILFPETHKQGNAAERVILLMTLHRDGSASRGEQLSRHQGGTEWLSVDDVYGIYTERPAERS